MPNKPFHTSAYVGACLAAVLWIAAASAGVGSMTTFYDAADSSRVSNAEDQKAISAAIKTGQVASLVAGCVLPVIFAAVFAAIMFAPKLKTKVANAADKHSNAPAIACWMATAVGLLLCIATASALIDGTNDLGILANTAQDAQDAGQPVMVKAVKDATPVPIVILAIGLAATVVLVITGFVTGKQLNK